MSTDSCLVVDIGNVSEDIPTLILQALPSKEVSLKEMWDELALGDIIPIRVKNNSDEDLSPCWLNYNETIQAAKKYDTCFWVPQIFFGRFKATINQLKHFRCLAIDLDPKVDPLFWTKMLIILRAWGAGELFCGIPAPHFFNLSGNGIHLYWVMALESATKNIRLLADICLRLVMMKFSSIFASKIDTVHRVHCFRVPESKPKSGIGFCRAFKVLDNNNEYHLKDFLIQCFDDDKEKELVESFLKNKATHRDLLNSLSAYEDGAGEKVNKKLKKNRKKSTKKPIDFNTSYKQTKEFKLEEDKFDGVNQFNSDTIGIFSKIIDSEPSCIRKDFAKRLIYILKLQSPIKCGCRNNRLFGLSIGLAKCGCNKPFIEYLVDLINKYYCEEPMTEKEVSCCYVKPDDFIYVTERKLREYLGIKKWLVFVKHETTMTRKQAAEKASSSSHKVTIKKLIDGYSELGFDVSISKLCEYTGVSRQTYHRYKKSGILTQEVFGYFINCCNYNDSKLNDLINSMSVENKNNSVFKEESRVTDQYLLAMRSESMADNSS